MAESAAGEIELGRAKFLIGLAALKCGFSVETEVYDHIGTAVLKAANDRVIVGFTLVVGLGDKVDSLALEVGDRHFVLAAAVVLVGPENGRLFRRRFCFPMPRHRKYI